MSKPTVHIVHCVDTEGPLEETLDATFERVNNEFSLSLTPSLALLKQLQNQELDFSGMENDIAAFIAPNRLAYLSTWAKVEEMILKSTDYSYRQKYASPDGSLYTYSWFIIDVVGYKNNPRRKAIGHHVIWDQYQRILKGRQYNDVFGWHFHTVPKTHEALDYNTCWTNNDFHEEVLARKIIERNFFPALFRSGGVIERNDLSSWLERFIPIDYSNQNNNYSNFKPGSQSDWRGAPKSWVPYSPCFYDYRKEGSMRRKIFRCLDVKTPGCELDTPEIERAFEEAVQKGASVLSYTNHDRRDIKPDGEHMFHLISEVAKRFPNVEWKYSNALEAARCSLGTSPKDLQLNITQDEGLIKINSNYSLLSGDLFLAIKEKGDIYYRDNVTIESDTSWAYTSPRMDAIEKIGVGGCTSDGSSACAVINLT